MIWSIVQNSHILKAKMIYNLKKWYHSEENIQINFDYFAAFFLKSWKLSLNLFFNIRKKAVDDDYDGDVIETRLQWFYHVTEMFFYNLCWNSPKTNSKVNSLIGVTL